MRLPEAPDPSLLARRGPSPDNKKLKPTLQRCSPEINIKKLLGDAGFDGEHNHLFVRKCCGIKSFFPPTIGRPSTRPLKGKYRRLMQRLFQNPKRIAYGQRWQIKTVFSMIKRRLTSAARARNYWSRARELGLLMLTYNLAILAALFWCLAFLQSRTVPISEGCRSFNTTVSLGILPHALPCTSAPNL